MVALGEVAPLVRRNVTIDLQRTYTEIGIRSFFRGTFHRRTVPGSEFTWQELFFVRGGDLLFSNLMAWEGAVAVAAPKDAACVGNHRILTCEVDQTRALPGFLYLYFRQPTGAAQLVAASPSSIARNRTLGPAALANLRIPLPPLAEQRRIVARLDGAAERIAKRTEAAKKVEAELGAMLQVAFRRMTSGASIVRLGDVAPLVRRTVTVDADRFYTEIGVRSFFRGTFHRRTVSGAEFTWQDLFTVHEGDLVFSNLMAWEGAVAVAGAQDRECVGNHRMLTCEVDSSRAVPAFLLFYFRQPAGSAQLIASSPGSIARNRTLGPAALADLRVPLPSLDVQKEFDMLHAKAQDALAAQENATRELDRLLPALLHEAFGNGTVELPRAAA